jgi:hypothetical protein
MKINVFLNVAPHSFEGFYQRFGRISFLLLQELSVFLSYLKLNNYFLLDKLVLISPLFW